MKYPVPTLAGVIVTVAVAGNCAVPSTSGLPATVKDPRVVHWSDMVLLCIETVTLVSFKSYPSLEIFINLP